ncbi:hypothetical protein EYZ11_010036 [Aspergillus tanneri]|nr:hypothetical protein EYZ11_010036 [Aspergillus tanneri]
MHVNVNSGEASSSSISTLRLDSVTLIRHRHRYRHRWIPSQQYRLRNSLLAAVGYLELANAGDFPANVWNEVPVPLYAAILMGFGGTLALIMSYFAFKDARLSWRNLCLLREERYNLIVQQGAADPEKCHENGCVDVKSIHSQLEINLREMGTEIVDRVGMDILLGWGAIMVGIGTLMAIGGANRKVWFASNLLSGYIGNSPAAIYGLVNMLWSTYIWTRADRHGIAAKKELDIDTVERYLTPRLRHIKLHAFVNGITGMVAGMASLVTATRWWGYVVLVPCIISSVWCNYFWRRAIGYERPFLQHQMRLSKSSLLCALQACSSTRQALEEVKSSTSGRSTAETASTALCKLISDPTSLAQVLEFIVDNDLLEDFCIRMLQNEQLATELFQLADAEAVTISAEQLLKADSRYTSQVLEIATQCVVDLGQQHFLYRERFLIETLGVICVEKN